MSYEHGNVKRKIAENCSEEPRPEADSETVDLTRPPKPKRTKTKSKTSDRFDEEEQAMAATRLPYGVRDGIRHLKPYWTVYRTWTKRRWLQRTFEDVFSEEFLSTDKNYARVACRKGRIFINGAQMTNPRHILTDNEQIVHIGHRHEHPILDVGIDVIADTPDYLVVNKPPSLPVHACGQYKAHTVLARLAAEYGFTGLRVVHRLDRTTSGVLIFAKNYETDVEFKRNLIDCDWKKEYVCRVKGTFPDGVVECSEPIGNLSPSMGIQCVRPEGRSARSKFVRLWTDGTESVVTARIATGRTHQIRVHLQWLGYPIVSDTIYNSPAWGPDCGKHGNFGKSFEQLREDVQDEHKASRWQEDSSKLQEYAKQMQRLADADETTPDPPDIPLSGRPEVDSICLGCHAPSKTPSLSHFRMHLHCWRYETSRGMFEAPLPSWAAEGSAGYLVEGAEVKAGS